MPLQQKNLHTHTHFLSELCSQSLHLNFLIVLELFFAAVSSQIGSPKTYAYISESVSDGINSVRNN